MSYDVRILVNGNNCRQYFHNGRTFIEAKDGSEYSIEVSNNTWQRILVCCSVDGLDILTGKTAVTDGTSGYVINGYCSNRFDGFRVSNDKVAKFIFGAKRHSYAASKQDGSEKNVGVIGVQIYNESIKLAPPPQPWPQQTWGGITGTGNPVPQSPTIWCDNTIDTLRCDYTMDDDFPIEHTRDCTKYSGNSIPTKGISSRKRSFAGGCSSNVSAESLRGIKCCSSVTPRGFDMGTEWGQAKESRVIEVTFEKGLLTFTRDIFYASRQSLIEMGVPIGNEKQVSLPSSFTDTKYAKPPPGWRG